MTFGIVSEGPTDQVVIEHLLAAFLENRQLPVTRLQPKEGQVGNWDRVFRYCASTDFKAAFTSLDYVIIHIDTDFMKGKNIAPNYKIDLQNLNPLATVYAFREKIKELIGKSFYERFSHQILFAIAVSEIECWLMPLCFEKEGMAASTKNCSKTLGKWLSIQKGYSIKLKRSEHYEEILAVLENKSTLVKYAEQNPSFYAFIKELDKKLNPS